jgi:hypothetical protein
MPSPLPLGASVRTLRRRFGRESVEMTGGQAGREASQFVLFIIHY